MLGGNGIVATFRLDNLAIHRYISNILLALPNFMMFLRPIPPGYFAGSLPVLEEAGEPSHSIPESANQAQSAKVDHSAPYN